MTQAETGGARSRSADSAAARWAESVFDQSVVKQEKYRRITSLLGDTTDLTCLDIGGDNGVISHLLRRRGGRWKSADLDETSVAAIRRVVGSDVRRVREDGTPFQADSFDLVVIVDFLEHTPSDGAFVEDLARIIRPGGALIVNVPRIVPRSPLRRLRPLVGLTDEKHGHVRPGYRENDLKRVLRPRFEIEESVAYSHAVLETVDLVLNAGMELLQKLKGRGEGERSRKGPVVTEDELDAGGPAMIVLRTMNPLLRLLARLDRRLSWLPGHKLVVRARLAG